MESTRDIKRRIKSITNIQQITRAMEMVASNRLRKAEARVVSARPYTQNITNVLGHLMGEIPEKIESANQKRETNKTLVLLVTSDKGLCGAYNTNIIQHAIKFIKENPQKEVSLQLLGKKGFLFFQRRPYKIEEYNTETVEKLGISSLQTEDNKITEMAAKLTKDFEENVYDEIYLFFSKFKSVMKSIPTGLRLLPVEDIGDGPNAPDEKKLIGDSILEPSAEDIFADLLPKYIEAQLRQAIFESLTSEYAARRVAMIAASENADGIIDELTRSYNRARQEAITNELLEVISGSEALVA